MNKFLVSIVAFLVVLGVVFAQGPVPGGLQGEGPRGGQGGQRGGGGNVVATANEKYLFVITNGTIYKYDVEGMILKGNAEVPASGNRRQTPDSINN